jgi:AcrR family transcriptional regulator
MDVGPGLRERKKQQTRHLLERTARRLFADRGFEQVSVAEIAKAADVSEATVFNYFPTKEDLVYGRMQTFEDALLQAIRERPVGEPVLPAFGRFVLQPRGFLAATDAGAAEELADLSRMIANSPALLAREAQILARYTDTLASVIADETGAGRDDPRPWITANALISVHRALLAYVRRRILAGHSSLPDLARDVRSHGETALAHIAHGLGDYAPKPPDASPQVTDPALTHVQLANRPRQHEARST